MTYFLISDNIDTLAGLRMVGVGGVVVHTADDFEKELAAVMASRTVGLVLITSKLFNDNRPFIFDYKLQQPQPLIIEMPDRHTGDNVGQNMKDYIQQAVGIKL